MTRVTLPAYAKVNLFLDVLRKLPDGYHELVTLFERVDLFDELTIETVLADRVELLCDHPDVPTDGSNLVFKAAERYREAADWSVGLKIRLNKRIPVAAGLGGGSSDAATTLQGLQILSGGILAENRLLEIARGLGADVAFFLAKSPWAIGTDRGDKIQPVSLSSRLWHLLVYPQFPVPTKSVYGALRLADRQDKGLTAPNPDVTLLVDALRDDQQVLKIRELLFNALEPTVEALYPALRQVKDTIQLKAGIPRPLVSGSGSTVMALCGSKEESERAAAVIRREAPEWRAFVVSTRS